MATATNLPASFTAGQVLTNTNMNDLRGAFRILQLLSTEYSTQQSTNSASYADLNLSLTITPQSTSNKILAVWFVPIYTDSSLTGAGLRLLRGTTELIKDIDIGYSGAGAGTNQGTAFYLDSPSSTSALTYKMQFARSQGAGLVYACTQGTANKSRFMLMEISA